MGERQNFEIVTSIVRMAMVDKEVYDLLLRVDEEDSQQKLRKLLGKHGLEHITDKEFGAALNSVATYKKLQLDIQLDDLKRERERNRETANNLSNELLGVIRQIMEGFDRVMNMYTVAFYMGVFLVFLGVTISLMFRENLLGVALGGLSSGLGFVDIAAIMIYKPANELQNSRGNLAQLQAALFTWINDMSNWNAFLERLDQSTSVGGIPSFDELEKVSKLSFENLERAMGLIEKFCELREPPK